MPPENSRPDTLRERIKELNKEGRINSVILNPTEPHQDDCILGSVVVYSDGVEFLREYKFPSPGINGKLYSKSLNCMFIFEPKNNQE
ncbi:MAG: hypothetical protein ABIC91_00355 [Nanoarchaeota archaeon]|nr:hypothetical protein [Nanoarchaeota archaeon]MBU1030585.1 hypothetical protein [Nanoarchaeota archaeon]